MSIPEISPETISSIRPGLKNPKMSREPRSYGAGPPDGSAYSISDSSFVVVFQLRIVMLG